MSEIQPGLCFFENVGNHLKLGFDSVAGDLRELGYRLENDRGEPTFGLFSAAEVGAPHRRERLFILAVAEGNRERELPIRTGQEEPGSANGGGGLADTPESRHGAGEDWQAGAARDAARLQELDRRSSGLGDAECSERRQGESAGHVGNGDCAGRHEEADRVRESGERLADATGSGLARGGVSARSRDEGPGASESDGAGQGVADAEHGGRDPGASGTGREAGSAVGHGVEGLCAFPPGPGDNGAWAEVFGRRPWLAPAVAVAEAESVFRGMADGLAYRVDRLRGCGNGVVPVVAAKAFVCLAAVAFGGGCEGLIHEGHEGALRDDIN